MKRPVIQALAATAVIGLALAGCGGGDSGGDASDGSNGEKKQYVVGVSNTLAGNGWREQMICAVKAQALASGQVSKVITISKNGDPASQIQDLQNLISQGVNAIIVNPSDPQKLNDVIAQAKKQNIVVVAVDSSVTAQDAYVVTNDQVAYGRLGMEWLGKKLNGKGDVLYIRGIQGVQADSDRHAGVQEALKKYPGIKLKQVWGQWDFTKAGQIATQELSAKKYSGIWSSGQDYTVVNAAKTAKQNIPMVGADTNAFIKQLVDGFPGAAVSNPAVIGGAGMAVALKALNGENPEKQVKLTPTVWDAENNKSDLEKNYFADKADTYSSAVQIPDYTNYNNDQLFACKGPGE